MRTKGQRGERPAVRVTNPPNRKASVPEWIGSLGMAAWVSGPDRTICHFNARAETLLGINASSCMGVPCYRIIDGRDAKGDTVCGPTCPFLSLVRAGKEIEPVAMRVRTPDNAWQWIRVVVIPVRCDNHSEPSLVHWALEEDKTHRMEDYLSKVAKRSPHIQSRNPAPQHLGLTKREWEVLQLLADDEDLHAIAARLHVSYITVRNHVQHILLKLGAHSIGEAVAQYLLLSE